MVQQAQGRVRPTVQMKGGVAINDDKGLETEADVMGTKAMQLRGLVVWLTCLRPTPPIHGRASLDCISPNFLE